MSIIVTCFGKWIVRLFAYPKIEILQVAAYGSVRKWTLTMNIGKHLDSNRENQLLSQDQCSNYVFTCFFFFFCIERFSHPSCYLIIWAERQVKSVSFWFNSVIWRSESGICSRYLEISSSSRGRNNTYFWLARGFEPIHLRPVRSDETLSWGISRLRHCYPR